MTMTESNVFKVDIINYVTNIYPLILEDYKDVLPIESINIIKNFNPNVDIKIDDGGKFCKGPGRWENSTKQLHLSPVIFNELTFKKGMLVTVKEVPLEPIEEKLKRSALEKFTGEELANLIRQKNLTYFDVTKGIVLHELFHSIIHMKTNDEVFSINYNGRPYDCNGVKGELLDEGFVEYYARKFSNKHNLFCFPSIPYQPNIEYAIRIEKMLGKNTDKLVFNGDYRTVLNYIHDQAFKDEYNLVENDWLQKRIIDRIKISEFKENLYDFGEVEELKLV